MRCACSLLPTSSDHARALSVWRRYENASRSPHTCLGDLTGRHLGELETWLSTEYTSKYVKRQLSRVRTAARYQGAEMATHLMDVSLHGVLDDDRLSELTPKEQTACRHYVRFLETQPENFTLGEVDEVRFQEFEDWIHSRTDMGSTQKYGVLRAFRGYISKGGGTLDLRQIVNDRSKPDWAKVVIPAEHRPLLEPYANYLKNSWSEATQAQYLGEYKRAVLGFLEHLKKVHHGGTSLPVAKGLFNVDAIDAWVKKWSADSNPSVHVRAIVGLLRYWSGGDVVDESTFRQCIRRVHSLAPRRKALKRVDSGKSDRPLSQLDELGRQYARKLKLRGFVQTATQVRFSIRKFVKWCNEQAPQICEPHELTVVVQSDYIHHLLRRHPGKSFTSWGYAHWVAGFWKWMYHRGELFEFDENVVPTLNGYPMISRALSTAEIQTLLTVIRSQDTQDKIKLRDVALAVLGLTTGARGVELRGLTFEDLNLENHSIRYASRKGPGRVIPLPMAAVRAIQDYLAVRPRAASPNEGSFVFLSGKWGLFGHRLQRGAIHSRFTLYRDLAGFPKHYGGFHCLRHTFAASLAADGVDVNHIRELLGHSSLVATNAYLRGGRWSSIDDNPTFALLSGGDMSV